MPIDEGAGHPGEEHTVGGLQRRLFDMLAGGEGEFYFLEMNISSVVAGIEAIKPHVLTPDARCVCRLAQLAHRGQG